MFSLPLGSLNTKCLALSVAIVYSTCVLREIYQRYQIHILVQIFTCSGLYRLGISGTSPPATLVIKLELTLLFFTLHCLIAITFEKPLILSQNLINKQCMQVFLCNWCHLYSLNNRQDSLNNSKLNARPLKISSETTKQNSDM